MEQRNFEEKAADLLVAVTPPPVLSSHAHHNGIVMHRLSDISNALQADDRVRLGHVRLSTVDTAFTQDDMLSRGVVWCATGDVSVSRGWESSRRFMFEDLVESVRRAPREARPRFAAVVMKYGPKNAAERLSKAGIPNVLWIKDSVFDHGKQGAQLVSAVAMPINIECQAQTAPCSADLLKKARDCYKNWVGELADDHLNIVCTPKSACSVPKTASKTDVHSKMRTVHCNLEASEIEALNLSILSCDLKL